MRFFQSLEFKKYMLCGICCSCIWVQNKLDICICKSQMNTMYIKMFSKIEIFCLLMYLGIVFKTNKCHRFLKVWRFLFQAWEAMGNEIYKQTWFFFLHVCACWCYWTFVMNLVIMVHHKKCTNLWIVQFLPLCSFYT